MCYIYILKLEKNKYYVGKTDNPQIRIDNHFNSNGSSWTRKYKPIEVIDVISDCDEFDEDKYTKKYMQSYGIDNVRGGSFCQMELDNDSRSVLERMIHSASDRCFKCGKEGHFINSCPFRNSLMCYKCGRSGHIVEDCYAKSHIDINRDLNGCYNCGRADHWKITCNYDKDIYNNPINKGLLATLCGW